MKKTFNVLIIMVCFVIFLTSVSLAGQKVTLRFSWWGGDSRHRATVKAIERYMELNPDVEIKPEYSGFSGYMDKLTTQYAGKNAPDISQLHTASVIEYASRGLIANLSSFKNEYFKDIDESLWGGFTQDGNVWAVPVGTNVVCLVFNKTMFDEVGVPYPKPGLDFNDLLEIAQKMSRDTNNDGQIDVYGIDSLYNPVTDYIHSISYMYGVKHYINNYQEVNFKSGAMSNYIEWAEKFEEVGAAPSAEDINVYSGGQNAINQRDVAMVLRNISDLQSIQAVLGDDKLGVVPAPKEPTTGLSGVFLKPSQAMVINRNTEHLEEAVKFLSWFLTSEEAAKIMVLERGVPSSAGQRAVLGELDLTEIQSNIVNWTNLCAEYADAIPQAAPPGDLEISTMVKEEELQKVFYGQITKEEAIENMQIRGNQILDRNRK